LTSGRQQTGLTHTRMQGTTVKCCFCLLRGLAHAQHWVLVSLVTIRLVLLYTCATSSCRRGHFLTATLLLQRSLALMWCCQVTHATPHQLTVRSATAHLTVCVLDVVCLQGMCDSQGTPCAFAASCDSAGCWPRYALIPHERHGWAESCSSPCPPVVQQRELVTILGAHACSLGACYFQGVILAFAGLVLCMWWCAYWPHAVQCVLHVAGCHPTCASFCSVLQRAPGGKDATGGICEGFNTRYACLHDVSSVLCCEPSLAAVVCA
jgi:hypothetical protein